MILSRGIFAAALVPGQRDSGTRKLFCPGTKGQRDVPSLGNPNMYCLTEPVEPGWPGGYFPRPSCFLAPLEAKLSFINDVEKIIPDPQFFYLSACQALLAEEGIRGHHEMK